MNSGEDEEAIEGVAVIGLAARIPGARSLDEFWTNLAGGVESITELTDEQLLADGVDPELLRDPNFVKVGSLLEDIAGFDSLLFGYSPAEAALIDPQQRIFLECAWEALEHAGCDPKRYKGTVGVYGGVNLNEYFLNNLHPSRRSIKADYLSVLFASDKDFLATRVAYKLDLRGPAIVVQSACSTSLVAISMAVDAILAGQCDVAIAGGVSLFVPHHTGYLYQEGGIASPDGHCRPFDADAKGTVFGSAAGVLVLKRLSDAVRDGDLIHAVVRGAAINNDGAAKVGYTAPSVDGQARVIAEAHAVAGVHPESVTYVEAHGTATPLGDPIEVAALTRAFGLKTKRKQFCAIGSVKGNVGHTNIAAGVVGVIKTVLAIRHRQIPPTLHFRRPNPKLDLENTPFYVNAELVPWAPTDGVLRAGVSSFGVGGTNAHLVLEQPPAFAPSSASRPSQLLLLSARTTAALDAATTRLAEHFRTHSDKNLADAAFTLAVGRAALTRRRFAVCSTSEEASVVLADSGAGRVFTAPREPGSPGVTFMFTGQGAQYVGMTRELYLTEREFREQVDRCAALLEPHLGLNLLDVLYAPVERHGDATKSLTETALAQPALFVVEYALARLFLGWGVRVDSMIGHSIGEYVAACLAGVFSIEDALRLVALRGRLMNQLPSGAMMAVPASEADVRPLLGADLSLAAVNGPALCVVSGPEGAVAGLESRLAERHMVGRRLHTSHAFHSAMMEPILDEFTREVAAVGPKAPTLPYLSNVSGTWITPAEATDPAYWARHLRGTVRFADGISELFSKPDRVLLEVGPGEAMCTLARRRPDKPDGTVVVQSIRSSREERSDVGQLLTALGSLWLAGVEVDWERYFASERRHRVELPTYPFQRQRLWIDAPQLGVGGPAAGVHAPADRTASMSTPAACAAGCQADAAIGPDASHSRAAGLERPEIDTPYLAPRNDAERVLAAIWQDALGIGRVGVDDDFFELGGDSLIAIQILGAAVAQLRVDMTLNQLVAAPTVAQLVAKVGVSSSFQAAVPVAPVVGRVLATGQPLSATERRLQRVWQDVLGTLPTGVHDSFLSAHGAADKLDRLITEVRREFGVFAEGIPVAEFRENPTISALARLIDGATDSSTSLIVPLQRRGTRRPLFLIHGGGGYVFFYRAFARRFAPDRPVYAVRAETQDDRRGRPLEKARSLEELAGRYVAEIKAIQPSGPYLLAGACFGGVVAVEMARQLHQAGESVAAPVILFDSWVFNNDRVQLKAVVTHTRREYLQRRILAHMGRSAQLGGVAGMRYLAATLFNNTSDALSLVPAALGSVVRGGRNRLAHTYHEVTSRLARRRGKPAEAEERQRRMMELSMEATYRLLLRYTPQVHEGRLLLFRAESNPDEESGWTGLATGGLDVHVVPGGHLDMLEEPAVAMTAELVARYIAETTDGLSSAPVATVDFEPSAPST